MRLWPYPGQYQSAGPTSPVRVRVQIFAPSRHKWCRQPHEFCGNIGPQEYHRAVERGRPGRTARPDRGSKPWATHTEGPASWEFPLYLAANRANPAQFVRAAWESSYRGRAAPPCNKSAARPQWPGVAVAEDLFSTVAGLRFEPHGPTILFNNFPVGHCLPVLF